MKKNKILNQNGATAIEFAIVLPLLLLLIFGIIEFSVLSYNKSSITNAGREGARAGVVYIPDWIFGDPDTMSKSEINAIRVEAIKDKINEVVTNYLQDRLIQFGGNPNGYTIIPDFEIDSNNEIMTSNGAPLTVIVDYTHRYLILPVRLAESHLSGQIRMKFEYP